MTSGGNDLSNSNGMSRALKTLDKYRNINLDNYGDDGEVQNDGEITRNPYRDLNVSSPFGSRKDPFKKTIEFHIRNRSN